MSMHVIHNRRGRVAVPSSSPVPFDRAVPLGRPVGPGRWGELERGVIADLHARLRTDAVREYLLLVARLSRKA
jgi:hypothetical protein